MLRWMIRLLTGRNKGGAGKSPGSTDNAPQSSRLGAEWEAAQREQRRNRQQQPPAPPAYGRLEIALDDGVKVPEKRAPRKDRRTGEERRAGVKDRRVRDIPVKEERRQNLWDRRRQYGERRFVLERRTGREGPQNHRNMQVYTQTGERVNSPEPSPAPLPPLTPLHTAPAPVPKTPSPAPAEATQPPENSLPLADETGQPVAYVATALPSGQYGLDLAGGDTTALVLRLDTPNGLARLGCGTREHALAIPCAMSEHEQLILTIRNNVTLHLDKQTRGDIVLGAEKIRLNLLDILQKKLPVTTLALGGIGSDIDMVEPQYFRFGGVTLHFDLTQTVEILDASGERIRISGPAGGNNFAKYKGRMLS